MLETLDFKPLDKKYYKLMLIRRVIFSLILIIALVAFFFINWDKEIPVPVFLIAGIACFAFVLLYLVLTKTFFNRKKYKIQDTNLSYRKGLLVQNITIVPFSRIQHIEIDEGPFERFFKLSTMSIYAAGDSGKDLKISGFKKEKAQEIKELITAYIKDE